MAAQDTTTLRLDSRPTLAQLFVQLDAATDVDAELDRLLSALGTGDLQIEVPSFEDPRCRTDADRRRRKEQVLALSYELVRRRAEASLRAAGLDDEDFEHVRIARRELREELQTRGKRGALALRRLDELDAARGWYVEHVGYLVPAIVDRYARLGVDRDDLCQEGYLGLLRAIEGYEWRRGVRFATYAKYWIQDSVLKALYDQSRTVRLPVWIQKLWQKMHKVSDSPNVAPSAELADKLDVSTKRLERVMSSRRRHLSLDQSAGNDDTGTTLAEGLAAPDDDDVRPGSDVAHIQSVLREAVDESGDREALILRKRFGLDGSEPVSLKRIGAELGLSAERVRQIQAAALARLRDRPAIARLAGS